MTTSRRVALGALVTAGLVFAPRVLWEAAKAYLFGHGDSKLGAGGGVVFAALIWGLMAVVAVATWVFVQMAFGATRYSNDGAAFWLAAIGSGIVLSVISQFGHLMPPVGGAVFGDIGGIAASWALVCIIIQLGGVALANKIAT